MAFVAGYSTKNNWIGLGIKKRVRGLVKKNHLKTHKFIILDTFTGKTLLLCSCCPSRYIHRDVAGELHSGVLFSST